MDQDKFNFNLEKLFQKFEGKNRVNKTKMLSVHHNSQSCWKNKNNENDKFQFPEPTYVKEHKRKGKPYYTYEYDVYDLAIFLTDREFYWHTINKRKLTPKG